MEICMKDELLTIRVNQDEKQIYRELAQYFECGIANLIRKSISAYALKEADMLLSFVKWYKEKDDKTREFMNALKKDKTKHYLNDEIRNELAVFIKEWVESVGQESIEKKANAKKAEWLSSKVEELDRIIKPDIQKQKEEKTGVLSR